MLLCLTMFCFSNYTMAQTNGTEVKVTVIDEQGSPISNVNVLGISLGNSWFNNGNSYYCFYKNNFRPI